MDISSVTNENSDGSCRKCSIYEGHITELSGIYCEIQKDMIGVNNRMYEMGEIIRSILSRDNDDDDDEDSVILEERHPEVSAENSNSLNQESQRGRSSNLQNPFSEVLLKDEPKDFYYTEETASGCLMTGVMTKRDERSPTKLSFEKNTTEDGRQPSVRWKNEGQHKCRECSRGFHRKDHFTMHMRTHSDVKPFECCECSKRFRSKYHLTKHMRTHSDERPFECCECSKRFSNRDHLTIHMRTHSGEKPFACDQCDKRFTIKVNLTRHSRTHSGEKPFECNICERRFADSSALTRHKRTHY